MRANQKNGTVKKGFMKQKMEGKEAGNVAGILSASFFERTFRAYKKARWGKVDLDAKYKRNERDKNCSFKLMKETTAPSEGRNTAYISPLKQQEQRGKTVTANPGQVLQGVVQH